MIKYSLILCTSFLWGAGCCTSTTSIQLKQDTTYKVNGWTIRYSPSPSVNIAPPEIRPIEAWRATKHLESYKKSHPKHVATLRTKYHGNESLVNVHIARQHARSASRNIEHLMPALSDMATTH